MNMKDCAVRRGPNAFKQSPQARKEEEEKGVLCECRQSSKVLCRYPLYTERNRCCALGRPLLHCRGHQHLGVWRGGEEEGGWVEFVARIGKDRG